MSVVVVVGGGAAGMMASIRSAQLNNKVILIEKNEKLGKKIYITGKGRCNLSNLVEPNEFLNNVVTNSKFMYGGIYSFSPQDTIDFFNSWGLKTKIERGNRVFPESDKASDVTKTLEKAMLDLNVDIRLNEKVLSIKVENDSVYSVITDKQEIITEKVIVCTGGLSYQATGSTGDGYTFAKSLGHNITPLRPSLVGVELKGNEFLELQGLSLKNVGLKCFNQDKLIYSDFGEALFTHFGVSGPIVLSASCHLNKYNLNDCSIVFDLKPALNEKTLDERIIREFSLSNNSIIYNVMRSLMPRSLIDIVLRRACIKNDRKCCEITQQQRNNLISVIKNIKFDCKKLRDINEAIVTSGGVDVKQINPKTMESKLVKGLHFAGEVLDVDGYTGGFNLQIAFSTGYLAGNS